MIGKILGNRYRLIEAIGEGGMALVYKAECSLLCRIVAVKILRPQYANDAEFVERFRREARSAASLSHPNVVNIYDVGQEDGIDYIVMEYIPGENLKNIIKKEAPFSVRKALDYTKQIAEALNHAHQRNIIHRDIKPHNILVTPDGQLKVTDFGIARAISASSFTQTGIVVGSVQYSSPEQVKAGLVGPQSDLYSLGCVFYELLTGTVPFKGDTSISIAMQHLHEKMVPVREIRPDVPNVVENIINKAMAKDAAARYPSAMAMLRDIAVAQSKLNLEIEPEEDLPTQIWSTAATKDATASVTTNKWFSKTVIGLSAGLLLVIGTIFFYILKPPPPEVVVPNLIGKDLTEARELLKQHNLNMKIINQLYNSDYPINRIVSQRPPAGQRKKARADIEVIVSKGPALVKVPNLIGKTKLEVDLALEEAGLKLGEVVKSYVADSPEGVVIKQMPEQNTQIEQGASVSITVNTMETGNIINVPNFIGRPLAEVRAELATLGLIYNEATLQSSELYSEGIIIDQNPLPYDKVPMGTAMSFIVSSGE
ncbi:MAG TPA: protein kinase [Bacillota bacterium]|nr:protein kinase [Bacillota bacterium]